MTVHKPYDTTPFVRISIEAVVRTLVEAVVLVFLVMYLFMQNLRATLIPTIAVPVVLLGTFGILAICGLTINTLTMFAMVLAIGLLVDDAIVVVENVERVMAEDGLSPRKATRKSMDQITGALVGVALVLAAVFMPMAFILGVLPLVLGSGAGAGAQHALGTAVIGGMLSGTLLAIFFVPLFFVLIMRIFKTERGPVTISRRAQKAVAPNTEPTRACAVSVPPRVFRESERT